MASTDPETNRKNAKGDRILPRVQDAMQYIPTPEEDDAREILGQLDAETRKALERATRPLGAHGNSKEAKAMVAANEPGGIIDQYNRHEIVIRMRAEGVHPTKIARATGLTVGTVNRIVTEYFKRKEAALRLQDMKHFILLMAEGYIEDIDRLTKVISETRHPTAIVGAIKARQEARQKYIDLLADFGFISRTPAELHVTGDGVTIDNRTQNVIVVSEEQIKGITKQLLAEKRKQHGEDSDEVEDDRLADLVVRSDDSAKSVTY